MIEKILEIVAQILNALATKVFSKILILILLFQEENEESLNVTTKKLRRI